MTTASFLATCISALTFVGTPSEGYGGDFRYMFSNLGDIGASIFVAMVLLPFYQSHKVTSIYEAVERKMGRTVRSACSGYFILTRTLASTVRIVAIAKVLEVVSGGNGAEHVDALTVLAVKYGFGRDIAFQLLHR